jgi:hypothetical protein
MTEYVELYIDQGSDFISTIVLQDDVTNLYQNVDGYVVTSSLRKSVLSQNASGNLTCTILDSANGEIELSMSAGQTANLREGTYLFDVRSQASGNYIRLIEGIIIVTPSITKY